MNSVAGRELWRAIGLVMLLLPVGLAACDDEGTGSHPGWLGLNLHATSPRLPAAIDSIEIEVRRTGMIAARDTVVPSSEGRFAAEFSLAAGSEYDIRLFAWGAAGDPWPDGRAVRGIAGIGGVEGIPIRAGRRVDATVRLDSATTRLLGVSGAAGYDSVRVWWRSVPGAEQYRLAWYEAASGRHDSTAALADTYWTATGSRLPLLASDGLASDSILFRARAEFPARVALYGPGRWQDLSLWFEPLRLLAIDPPAGSTVAAETVGVTLAFDRLVEPSALAAGVAWLRLPAREPVAFEVSPPSAADRFRLDAVEPLAMGTDFQVRLDPALVARDGRPFDGDPHVDGLQPDSVTWSTAAYDPLRVTALDPPPGASDVARDTALRVRFSRALDAASVTPGALYVTDSWQRTLPAATISVRDDSVLWSAADPFWFATRCTLHVTPELRALDGGHFDQDPATYPLREGYQAVFTTLPQPVGPRVAAIEPDSGATAVARESAITVTFAAAVDPATVSPLTTFRVLRGGTVGIPGALTHDPAARQFAFRPQHPLERGATYVVRLWGELPGGGGITDAEGNRLDQDRTALGYQPFESHFEAETPPTVIARAFEPERADTFVARNAVISLRFGREIDAASVTPQTVVLTRAGEAIAASRSWESGQLWLRLTPADSLQAWSYYTVTVDTLVATPDGSRLDQDPDAPGRQPFVFGFTTVPDSLHPAVAEVMPADGATGVAADAVLTVSFAAPVDPNSVGQNSFLLEALPEGEPEPVAGHVTATATSASFTPDTPLAADREHRLRLTSAITDPSGLYGLDQEPDSSGLQAFTSTFRTEPERIPPRVESVSPADGAVGIGIATEIALLFSEAMATDGFAGAFALHAGADTIAGSGSWNASDRIWTFTPEGALDWARTYSVAVDTTARDLAGNRLDQEAGLAGRQPFASVFTTEADREAPRVAWREPATGAEAVAIDAELHYGFDEPLDPATVTPEAFRLLDPAATAVPLRLSLAEGNTLLIGEPIALPDSVPAWLDFGATYTVVADTLLADANGNRLDQDRVTPGRQADVSFFATMAETLAPRVTALTPSGTSVPVAAQPRLTFSEPMTAATLQAPGVVTLTRDGEAVACSLVIAAGGDTLRLLPHEALAYDSEHTIGVDTLATDLLGNYLDQHADLAGRQSYSATFRTVLDTEPPTVVAIEPEDGSGNLPPDVSVTLTFSEPLDPSTVNDATVYMTGPGGTVALAGGPVLTDGDRVIQLVPADPLPPGATYTVVVRHLVTDVHGNAMEHEPGQPAFSATLSTGAFPVIVWDGGLCAPGDTARVVFDAASSYDPDPTDSVAVAIWDWGDGVRDTLAAPEGLVASHQYGCLDLAGCDGLDNDGDGAVDETGPQGCDESYRIVLELVDGNGDRTSASAGVSFCAFLVTAASPAAGALVGSRDPVRLDLSHGVLATSLDSSVVFLRLADSTAVPHTRSLTNAGRTLWLHPQGIHGGEHLVRLTPGVTDSFGVHLDQGTCLPGDQAFELRFRGPPKPPAEEATEGGDDPLEP